MRIPRIVEAMQYLDDELISEAIAFRRVTLHTRIFRKPFMKACACFLVIAIVLGIGLSHIDSSDETTLPFVLTAYAISPDNADIVTTKLEQGVSVPVSYFETSSGILGFVFSCENTANDTVASISVITHGNFNEYIDEIVGIAIDPSQNYYIFIPSETEVIPYTVFISSIDMEDELVYELTLQITQQDNEYYAELISETTRDVIMK
ncbi:MAG: hypothetical protein LUH18_07645 [Oscillospiraceae bacterium]|nr:hypothetical protein [Oscillospiraceae bacterium]